VSACTATTTWLRENPQGSGWTRQAFLSGTKPGLPPLRFVCSVPHNYRYQQQMPTTTFRVRLLIAAMAAVLGTHSNACIAADGRERLHQAWGYQPWWMHANWQALDLGLWDRAIYFELRVEADGSIANAGALPVTWRKLGRATARCGSALDLAFTLFDERKFERLFSSAAARDTLLREIVSLVKAGDAMGVHLDFEVYGRVGEEALQGFREFVGRLRRDLDQESPGRILSVFGVVGAARDLYDRATLSNIDFVVIQGYDAHWDTGLRAGSIAPLTGNHSLSWERSLRHYLRLGAERSRLLFSIPFFGYEWPVTSAAPGSPTTGDGQEMTYARLPRAWVPRIPISAEEQSKRYGTLRDPETGSPYYAYQDASGHWRQGWFEDQASLAEKLAFIRREGLAGVAAFPLGYDAGAFDPLLARAFGKRPDCRASDIEALDAKAAGRAERSR
jgi:hypothetical protein